MLKRLLKKLRNAFSRILGYEYVKIQSLDGKPRFQIYQYRKSDGKFDYENYKNTQVKGNKRKLKKSMQVRNTYLSFPTILRA